MNEPQQGAPSHDRRARVYLGTLLALTALASLHRTGNAFVWDDPSLALVAHDAIASGQPLQLFRQGLLEAAFGARGADIYRPLGLLSLSLNVLISGPAPWSYHLTNLLLHLCNVWLVWRIGRRLLGNERVRTIALGAALFALGPQIAIAHLWISGRFDLLATTFLLLAVWLWSDAKPGAWRSMSVGACFLMALLSKETAVGCLPALLLLPGVDGLRPRLRRLVPWLSALVVYLPLRLWALDGAGASSWLSTAHVALALRHLPLLWLHGLQGVLAPAAVYPHMLLEQYATVATVWVIACAAVVAVLVVLAFRARQRQPLLWTAAVWYLGLLTPAALATADYWPGFGRYLYLPAALLVLAAAQVLSLGAQRMLAQLPDPARMQRLMALACYAYLLSFGMRTALYTLDFRSNRSLYGAIVQAAPERSHGYAMLGFVELDARRPDQARALLARAIEINPERPTYFIGLAAAQELSGAAADAKVTVARGLSIAPERQELLAMDVRLRAHDDPVDARKRAERCVRRQPDNAQCQALLTALSNPPTK